MDKMRFESKSVSSEYVEKLAHLFPGVVTEGKVNFDLLRSLLGDEVHGDEAYEFTWVGKRAAIAEAGRPIRKTLRPCKKESKNWDTTENLYIEGDNLDVLKLLQESYLGKVKMIYIDPPYNTGNDFVFRDNFTRDKDDYDEEAGVYNEDGERLFRNTASNGRFHSDWCSMIYPRLVLARNLLRDDGVMYISIDDNEVVQLRKMCDEVFGESNFSATIVWQKKYAATNDSKGFSTTHDYIIVYQKSLSFDRNLLPRTSEQNKPYRHDDGDGKGLWRSDNLLVKSFSKSGVYPIINPNTGEEFLPPEGSCWRASHETMKEWLSEKRIFFGKDGKGAPQLKRYLNEVQQGKVPVTWWTFGEVGHNDAANKEVSALFESKV
jgi:adenine-specific DNA-methyltransferase